MPDHPSRQAMSEDMCADATGRRQACTVDGLARDLAHLEQVVVIEDRDHRAARASDAQIARRGDAASRTVEIDCARRDPLDHRAGVVGRAVVDENDLDVVVGVTVGPVESHIGAGRVAGHADDRRAVTRHTDVQQR